MQGIKKPVKDRFFVFVNIYYPTFFTAFATISAIPSSNTDGMIYSGVGSFT